MYRKTHNALTSGCSGKFGNQLVVRHRFSKEIICQYGHATKWSEAQDMQRARFRMAGYYATSVKYKPELKARYDDARTNGNNFRNVAMRDFFNPPDIKEVDVNGYNGSAGSYILITAEDDFMMASVSVCIYDSHDNLVEKGAAVQLIDNRLYGYTTTAQCTDPEGCRIEIIASDMPGNEAVGELWVAVHKEKKAKAAKISGVNHKVRIPAENRQKEIVAAGMQEGSPLPLTTTPPAPASPSSASPRPAPSPAVRSQMLTTPLPAPQDDWPAGPLSSHNPGCPLSAVQSG